MATNTYVALDTQTLGTAASSVTFSSIPQGYTDLIVVCSVKGTASSAYLDNRFNGDTGANYSQTTLYGNGSSPGSSGNSGQPIGYLAQNPNIDNTNYSLYIVNYNNYSNTTTYKNWLVRCGSASFETEAGVGLWRSTAAINQLDYFLNTGNFAAGSTFTLYGVTAWAGESTPKATGGYVYSDANYWYHSFTFSGNFVPNQALSCDILVVAGGGGGGSQGGGRGGGGGAGGVVGFTAQSLSATSYAVTVGAGASASIDPSTGNGSNSQFGSLTAAVGGGGGSYYDAVNGKNGGSGGGSWYTSSPGSGTSGQGYAGGLNTTSPSYGGGGGGGAGATGGNGTTTIGGAGGNGATYNTTIGGSAGPYSFIDAMGAATGTGELVSGHYYYGGGGASDLWGGLPAHNSGAGGYGGGATANSLGAGGNGMFATGGGGGAGGSGGSQGGSGVVIVRYAK